MVVKKYMDEIKTQMARTQIEREVREAIKKEYGDKFESTFCEEEIYELSRFLLIILNSIIKNQNYIK